MRGAASLAAAAARWPVRVRGAGWGRQVPGAVERRRSGRCGGCGAENGRGPGAEEQDELVDRLLTKGLRSGFCVSSSN